MLHAATDLMRYDAIVDGTRHRIAELYLNCEMGSVSHVSLERRPLPERYATLINAKHLGMPDSETRTIGVGATEATLASAPRQSGETLLSTLAAIATDPDPDVEADKRAERVRATTEALGGLVGAAIVGREGDEVIGKIEDFLLEWPRPHVTHVVVNTGKLLPNRQVVVPAELIISFNATDGAVRLDLDEDKLQKAPEIQKMDMIDRNWLDSVRTYYQLPL
jgi:hypothetical protein